MRRRQRIARIRNMFQDAVNAKARDQFKTRRRAASRALGVGEQRYGVRRFGDAGPDRNGFLRAREQLQHRAGDDPERAFAADKQLFQVVPGIVLTQTFQPVPDLAVCCHRLKAKHQIAHIAVAQNIDAAGVGGDDAANLACAFRSDGKRKEPVRFSGRALRFSQSQAGVNGHRIVQRRDVAHPPHALQRKKNLLAEGDLAAHQSGVAALRRDRHVSIRADFQDFRDLLGRGRRHDHRRLAGPAVAPFGQEGRAVLCSDYAFAADDSADSVQRFSGRGALTQRFLTGFHS